jgi:hypothetical protein
MNPPCEVAVGKYSDPTTGEEGIQIEVRNNSREPLRDIEPAFVFTLAEPYEPPNTAVREPLPPAGPPNPDIPFSETKPQARYELCMKSVASCSAVRWCSTAVGGISTLP